MLKKYSSILFLFFLTFNSVLSAQTKDINALFKRGTLYKYSQPDLAIKNFEECHKHSLYQRDSTLAIKSLMSLAEIYSHHTNYNKAYDNYWKALILADLTNDDFRRARIYQGLGWLYSFYKRDDEALKYFNKSLDIDKKKSYLKDYVGSDYFSIVNFYRIRKNEPMFKVYLDSFTNENLKAQKKNISSGQYLQGEIAHKLALEGEYTPALAKLEKAKLFFQKKDSFYLVVIHHLIGDVYKRMKQYKKSEEAFLKSIEISKKSNSHTDYNIMNYEALLDISIMQKDYKKALKYKTLGSDLNNKIFGIKSVSNQNLFELKDNYRITKEKEEKLKQEERLKQLEQEEYIWFLKYVILIGSIIFLIIFGFLFFRQLKSKHFTEKKLLKERQKQELKTKNEIIELKNKELTSQALQLIEKEEFLASLTVKLSKHKENIDTKVVSRLVKSMQGNPTSNWKEFEARFTQINQSFYKNLKEQFPNLGPTDQKVCALIKLNFSSKDMASLLGISVESVHTSRYRLRKKLGLKRNENLSAFINAL